MNEQELAATVFEGRDPCPTLTEAYLRRCTAHDTLMQEKMSGYASETAKLRYASATREFYRVRECMDEERYLAWKSWQTREGVTQ